MPETYDKIKVVEQTPAFTSSSILVRELKNITLNFKRIPRGYVMLLKTLIWKSRSFLSLTFNQFNQTLIHYAQLTQLVSAYNEFRKLLFFLGVLVLFW